MSEDDALDADVDTVQRYLETLFDPEADPDAIGAFLHPDVEMIEHPNAIAPTGHRRTREEALEGARSGRQLLRRQGLEDQRISATAEVVTVRATWRGELAHDAGAMSAGDVLTAHLAMFFTVRDGRIVRQENYDCYEPLPGT